MKTVYNIFSSILCIVGTVILEAVCIGKYIFPISFSDPYFSLIYDIEIILCAVIFFALHYFLFDRIAKHRIYFYIVGAFEIILSLFMFCLLYFPGLPINAKFYDCIVTTLVQFVILISRVFFMTKQGRKTSQRQDEEKTLSNDGLFNIFMSVLCIFETVILEALCFEKYLYPIMFSDPNFSLQYDIRLVLFAVVIFALHYFLFDRIAKNRIYFYIVGAFEIILSLFMLYLLYFPDTPINAKFYDCIGVTLVQFVILISRVFFMTKHRKNSQRQPND